MLTWLQLKLEIRPRARAAVSKVLLVGGATRMPAVQRFIVNMTGLIPEGPATGVDPDEAVALGAAVQVWCQQLVDSLLAGGLSAAEHCLANICHFVTADSRHLFTCMMFNLPRYICLLPSCPSHYVCC